jgi:hypothetical protein
VNVNEIGAWFGFQDKTATIRIEKPPHNDNYVDYMAT